MIFGPEFTPPEAWLRCAEKRELLRTAAQSALDRSDGGKTLDPLTREWAKHWASHPPLTLPMSDGTPKVSNHV